MCYKWRHEWELFQVGKGAEQGDSISGYFFVCILEISFIMISSNPNIKPINIFYHNFLYTTYADETAFFINNKNSVIELQWNWLNENAKLLEKVFWKKIKMALCGIKKRLNLENETVKVIGCHY